jgi:mono/diheme cytochrome c family protein
MIRVLMRVVVILVGIIATGAAALLIALQLGWARHHDVPEPSLRAVSDSAVIERGRYLVYGPAACAYCHRPKADWPRLARGEMPPLSGNHEFPLPFGAIFSSNLTSQTQLHRLTFLGRLLLGVVMTPSGPSRPPLEPSPAGATVERGAYLANDVASCVSCHTDRQRGELVGPRFAGGQRMDFAGDATRVLVPPNLTPDPATGRIASWSEDTFIARFRNGASIPETIMPWGAYSRMTEDDLRALYRYLRSLPPVHRDTARRCSRNSSDL